MKNENKKNAKPAMTNSPSTSNKKMVWFCSIFEASLASSRKVDLWKEQTFLYSKILSMYLNKILKHLGFLPTKLWANQRGWFCICQEHVLAAAYNDWKGCCVLNSYED